MYPHASVNDDDDELVQHVGKTLGLGLEGYRDCQKRPEKVEEKNVAKLTDGLN